MPLLFLHSCKYARKEQKRHTFHSGAGVQMLVFFLIFFSLLFHETADKNATTDVSIVSHILSLMLCILGTVICTFRFSNRINGKLLSWTMLMNLAILHNSSAYQCVYNFLFWYCCKILWFHIPSCQLIANLYCLSLKTFLFSVPHSNIHLCQKTLISHPLTLMMWNILGEPMGGLIKCR